MDEKYRSEFTETRYFKWKSIFPVRGLALSPVGRTGGVPPLHSQSLTPNQAFQIRPAFLPEFQPDLRQVASAV